MPSSCGLWRRRERALHVALVLAALLWLCRPSAPVRPETVQVEVPAALGPIERHVQLQNRMCRGEIPFRAAGWRFVKNVRGRAVWTGGLGNQWEAIVHVYFLALLTDRAFFLDSANIQNGQTRILRPAEAEWRWDAKDLNRTCPPAAAARAQDTSLVRECDAIVGANTPVVFCAGAWRTRLSSLFHWDDQYANGPTGSLPYPPALQAKAEQLGLDRVQHPLKEMFDAWFRPAADLQRMIDIVTPQGDYIGIHFRSAWYGGRERQEGGLPQNVNGQVTAALRAHLDCASALCVSSPCAVYLATDNQRAVDTINMPKEMALVNVSNLPRQTHDDADRTRAGLLRAYTDIVLLSRARAMVGSHKSSFTWLAAGIGAADLFNGQLEGSCTDPTSPRDYFAFEKCFAHQTCF